MFVSELALLVVTVSVQDPTPVSVPPVLLEQGSMPELSGMAWCPALKRYLVVSDDTGRKDQHSNHAAWLFALSEDGALDEAVVPIRGLPRINDLEAITAGPGSTYFLTTSHSHDRKGRVRPERKLLMVTELKDRALEVRGHLDLTADAAQWREATGLPEDAGVDIEGLAYKDGALFIGLKAPLSFTGRAMVLRLPNADAVLRAGSIPPGGLQRFAEVPLQVEHKKETVGEGISDLTFLPDGTLLILANSPKGSPKDGGGALWRWEQPGTGAPVLLHRFPGLKPEGITRTADGKAWVVVFDRDQETPLWTRVTP